METLKQHNKLWSKEAMFTHDYLEVPVSRAVYEAVTGSSASPQSPSTQSNGSDRLVDICSSLDRCMLLPVTLCHKRKNALGYSF